MSGSATFNYTTSFEDTGILYHAATRSDWDSRSETHYEPAGYRDEGFVHLSTGDQLLPTMYKHYPDRTDLLLVGVDPREVSAEVVWEDVYGTGVEFPHLYGPVELAAVVHVVPMPCDRDGRFDWWRPGAPAVVHPSSLGTDTVHGLLRHLRESGFTGCPEPLWHRNGLEAVSYIRGETVRYPLPGWLRETEPLQALGSLLRGAHDASESFRVDGPHRRDGPWQVGTVEPQPGWVVNHRDLRAGKVVWRDGEPIALTDWEFAEPGPREYDLIDVAVNLCGHVEPSERTRRGLDGLDIEARLSAFASGYGGVTGAGLRAVAPDVISEKLAQHRRRVEAGIERWVALEADAVGDRLAATLPFLRESAGPLDGSPS